MKKTIQIFNLMSWSADDGWEHGSWCIVTGEASFAHTRSIVNNESSNFFVTHGLGTSMLQKTCNLDENILTENKNVTSFIKQQLQKREKN